MDRTASRATPGASARGLALGVAALACAALAACTSKAERIETSLRKGTLYVAQADWDKAGIEARNVLQMDPKNGAAYLISAEVEDGRGALRNAFANYQKVLELAPASVDARLGLARLYLLSGDVAQAAPLVDGVLAAGTPGAANPRAQALHAVLLARQGDKARALAEADALVKSGARLPVESSLALAGLYFNAGANDAALGVLDAGLAQAPRESRLLQMAAEVAQSGAGTGSGTAADAAAVARADGYYGRAIAAAPKNDALWRDRETMHLRHQDPARAEALLREAVAADPDSGPRRLALLEFVAAFRDHAQAEQAWLAAIEQHPKDTDLRFALASFYRAQKRPDDAVRTLAGIVEQGKDTPAGTAARGELAALALESGRIAEARATLAELLKANPRDATGLVLRGRLEIADGDARSAIADLRSAAKDRPGSTEIAALLARAHRLAGEPQLAREALADAVKFNPDDVRAHLMLAADMAQAREFKAAQPEIEAAIKADPRNLPARQMQVEMAMATGDFAAAEAEARAVQAAFPQNPAGHLLAGRVLAAQKKLAPALAEYDAATAMAPRDAEAVVAAVGLLTAQKRFADAGTRVDALVARDPQAPLGVEMRGELALARGDIAGAEAAFKQLAAMPGAPASAFKSLAAIEASRNDLAGALATLERGEKAWPADLALPAAHAEWLGRAGRVDEAIAIYEAMLKRAPDSELAANNLAYVLVQRKGDPASLDRALHLADRFAWSEQAGYVDTLGLVQYRLGRFDQAANVLQRAAALAPGDASVQLHYGMALVKKGDVRQGAEIVRKALAGKATLPEHDEAQALIAST